MARTVVESECPECGQFHVEPLLKPGSDPESSIAYCYTGGSRRVLDPEEFVLVEKVDGEWLIEALENLIEYRNAPGMWAQEVLDALAGGNA